MTKANSQQPIQHQVSSTEEKKDEIFEKQTTTGRIINSVTLPPSNRLTAEELFPNDKIDTKLLRDHLKQEGRLTEECALKVIKEGTDEVILTAVNSVKPWLTGVYQRTYK